MKLLFNTENKTVELQNSNNEMIDFWKVENEKIATISGNGNTARIYTKDYGSTNVVVTDLRSGISMSYKIGTAVKNFIFTEDTGETSYGYPMITLVLGETISRLAVSYHEKEAFNSV